MEFCNLVIEEVFNNIDGFEVPNKFGTLQIIGIPANPKLYGWKRGQLKLARTENYVYALRWLKHNYRCKVKNIHYFESKTGLLIRRKIQKAIIEDRFYNWLKLDNYSQICRLEDMETGKGVTKDNFLRKKGQGLLKRQLKKK